MSKIMKIVLCYLATMLVQNGPFSYSLTTTVTTNTLLKSFESFHLCDRFGLTSPSWQICFQKHILPNESLLTAVHTAWKAAEGGCFVEQFLSEKEECQVEGGREEEEEEKRQVVEKATWQITFVRDLKRQLERINKDHHPFKRWPFDRIESDKDQFRLNMI